MGRAIDSFREWIIESIPWSDVWLFSFWSFLAIVGAFFAVIIGGSDLPTWLKYILIFGGMFLFLNAMGWGSSY